MSPIFTYFTGDFDTGAANVFTDGVSFFLKKNAGSLSQNRVTHVILSESEPKTDEMADDRLEYFKTTIYPCAPRMYAAAFAITRSEADAADAVQTAMLRIWEAISGGAGIDRPMSYCLTAVRNICLNELTQSGRTVSIDACTQDIPVEDNAETSVELDEVSAAMARLPDTERRALEMRAYAGLSSEDIGAAMGVSACNARQLLSRGRRRLRSFFNR